MRRKTINADELRDKFDFLLEYGLTLVRKETLNFGAYVAYKGNGVRVELGFDYRDYFFYFKIFKGENLKYSDAAFGKEIRSFCDLAEKYDPNYDCEKLQPNYQSGYEEALENNILLIKRHGESILKGNEWF